ncbi:MAG TPA: hypothetical protein VNX28_05470, partial [Gemmataceae bacterium]|nr:hypothetical protein [Gemmataceae bacterium]
RILIIVFLCNALIGLVSARANENEVIVIETPGRGIQPQAAVDAKGNLHLLYFQGEAKGGNLLYVRRDVGQTTFSQPLRVNSQEGSAIAIGTIRGGHLALGKNGRVHVAWNGSMQALPKNPITGTPMLYARLNDSGTDFEPQRNLMTKSAILDGGGSLAADREGNVYVAWHALGQDLVKGEDNRRVWVSVSGDNGKTFAAEKPAWKENTGACGCCGMRGFADREGNAYIVYRAASEKINRGMYLLRSPDRGQSFAGVRLDNWEIATCPMSSEAFAEGPNGIYTAWDNDEQIFFTRIQGGKIAVEKPKAVPGQDRNQKHPALAVNKMGDVIVVWTEGTGWNRGGALAWQVYDKAGKPTPLAGLRPGAIPVWGLPAVVAEADGRFTIFH